MRQMQSAPLPDMDWQGANTEQEHSDRGAQKEKVDCGGCRDRETGPILINLSPVNHLSCDKHFATMVCFLSIMPITLVFPLTSVLTVKKKETQGTEEARDNRTGDHLIKPFSVSFRTLKQWLLISVLLTVFSCLVSLHVFRRVCRSSQRTSNGISRHYLKAVYSHVKKTVFGRTLYSPAKN